MRLLIVTLLIISLVWQGCHSFSVVKEDEGIQLRELDTEDIKLNLTDGTEIISPAYLHTMIAESSNFIMGTGSILVPNQAKAINFEGKIDLSVVDTLIEKNSGNGAYLICNKKDGQCIVFEENNYFIVLPRNASGLYVKGTAINGTKVMQFSEPVILNRISNFEIMKPDWVKTTSLILFSVGVLVLLAAASSMSMSFGGTWQ